jgi:hypothetical protein
MYRVDIWAGRRKCHADLRRATSALTDGDRTKVEQSLKRRLPLTAVK